MGIYHVENRLRPTSLPLARRPFRHYFSKARCYCGGKYRRKNWRKSTKVAVNAAALM